MSPPFAATDSLVDETTVDERGIALDAIPRGEGEPADDPSDDPEPDARRYGGGRLALGIVGRMWLWFLGGVLIVTLIPMIFGWRPFVVETGSMAPAIKAGDVVLASPNSDPDVQLGRVIVFESPARDDMIVTHRVIEVNPDGSLVTKGDNNRSPDSEPVAQEQVRGLGRLLVRGAGLPMLWLREGAWAQLGLFAASIWLAALAVARDQEDDDELDVVAEDEIEVPLEPVPTITTAAARPVGVIPRAREPEGDSSDDADDEVDGRPDDRSAVRTLPRGPRVGTRSNDDEATTTLPRASDSDAGRDDEQDADRDDDQDVGNGGAPGAGAPTGASHDDSRPTAEAATRASTRTRTIRSFLGVLGVGLTLLGTPTMAAAAFTGTTSNAGNAWDVPNVDYGAEINALGPYLYWQLDETNGNTAIDSSGNNRRGRYRPNPGTGAFTRLTEGALPTDTPNRAVRLNVPNACIIRRSNTAVAGPQVFTVVAWFRAPSTYTDGGKLLGFERPRRGTAAPPNGNYDRQLYVDGSGQVWFTSYNGGHFGLSSAPGLNDGQWHMAVGAQDAGGMRLYIDGLLVDSNTNTAAEPTTGWWRAGCGNLAGWGGQWTGPNNPGTSSGTPQNRPFLADLDELTVYSGVSLTSADVATLWFAR